MQRKVKQTYHTVEKHIKWRKVKSTHPFPFYSDALNQLFRHSFVGVEVDRSQCPFSNLFLRKSESHSQAGSAIS